MNGAGQIAISTNRKGGSFSVDLNPPAGVADLTQMVGFSTTIQSGTETPIPSDLSTANLNDLTANLKEYVNGGPDPDRR